MNKFDVKSYFESKDEVYGKLNVIINFLVDKRLLPTAGIKHNTSDFTIHLRGDFLVVGWISELLTKPAINTLILSFDKIEEILKAFENDK